MKQPQTTLESPKELADYLLTKIVFNYRGQKQGDTAADLAEQVREIVRNL